MTTIQQAIIVGAGVVATMLTRFIPFVVFRPGKPTPKYIMYLGKVLPASVFAMLVVYCLRTTIDTSNTSTTHWQIAFSANYLAQFAAIAITIGIHLWRKNLMLSIAIGTIAYMIMIR